MAHHDFEVDCEYRLLLSLALKRHPMVRVRGYLMRKIKPTMRKSEIMMRMATLAPIGGHLEHLYCELRV